MDLLDAAANLGFTAVGALAGAATGFFLGRRRDGARRRVDRTDTLFEKLHSMDLRLSKLENDVKPLKADGYHRIKGGRRVH